MQCLTEILKYGVMSDDTRDAVDQLEADFFIVLKQAGALMDIIDENDALQGLADNDDGVKELLCSLYNLLDEMSYCYNLKPLDQNKLLK